MRKQLATSTVFVCLTIVVCLMLVASGCNKQANPTSPSSFDVSPIQRIDVASSSAGGDAMTVGESRQLRAKARLTDGTVEDITALAAWSSDNPSVATVSSGLVTAVGPGTGRIYASFLRAVGGTEIGVAAQATAPDSSSSSSSSSSSQDGGVTVQSLSIVGGSTVPAGRSIQLRAIANMSDGTQRDVTGSADWGSDNSAVSSVSQSGILTGVSPGANVVTARHGGSSASQPVLVTLF